MPLSSPSPTAPNPPSSARSEGADRGPTYHLADRHGRRYLGRLVHGVSHRPVPRPQGRRRARRPPPLLRTCPPPRPPAPTGLAKPTVGPGRGGAILDPP